VLAADDGSIKADFGAAPTSLDDQYRFVEHVALDREELCAFGRLPADRGGLVPDPHAGEGFPVLIWRGPASRVRRKILLGLVGHGALSLALTAVAGAILWWVGYRL
jgi:hypothetical protein